jgi:pimeloyl-ACP methyl ester carboxylesterase
MGTEQAIVHNLKITYDVNGEGQAILFIHGWAGSRLHWDPAPSFLPGFKTIAIDLYGFGDSEEPSRVSIPEDYVELVCGFIKQLDIEHVILVAHSVGGLIAANVTLRFQELMTGLVLVEAPVGKELRTIKCPVLLVFGDRNSQMNGLSRVEVARAQLTHNSSAQVRFIENAAHNPMLENVSSFYDAVRMFSEKLKCTRDSSTDALFPWPDLSWPCSTSRTKENTSC